MSKHFRLLLLLVFGCSLVTPASTHAWPWDDAADWIRKQGVPLPLPPGHPSWAWNRSPEATSEVQTTAPPTIDDNGNVWSGTSSGNGGYRGAVIGKARLDYDDQGQAWWTYYSLAQPFENSYGRVEPRRAPSYLDRPAAPPFQQPNYPPAWQQPQPPVYQPQPQPQPLQKIAVRIINATGSPIFFRIHGAGAPDWCNERLEPGRSMEGVFGGQVEVAFGDGLGNVRQGIIPPGVHYFNWLNGRLNLDPVR